MKMSQEQLLENAKKSAQKWLDAFKTDGKHDIEKIKECLNSRTFNGEPVTALVAKSPDEAVDMMNAWAKKQDKSLQTHIKEVFANAHNCIWDYHFMAFYESACQDLEDKNFDGAEFIYQSLFPAFKAGLGYVINLGSLIVGVCLPEAHRDDQMRIHRSDGPAIIWGNDKSYWWHGIQVPADWIMNKDSIDPSLCLTHPNIEERRALCEIIGWDKVVDMLNPEILDKDPDPQIGTLLQVDLPDGGIQKFLRAEESSTGRIFCIGIPNSINTALDAQAEINQIPKELFKSGYVRS